MAAFSLWWGLFSYYFYYVCVSVCLTAYLLAYLSACLQPGDVCLSVSLMTGGQRGRKGNKIVES